MQVPIISQRGQNKPWASIPRINWAHPLARGLLFYHYDTPAGGFDLAHGRRSILNSANRISVKTTKFGTGYQYTGAGSDGAAYVSDVSIQILPPFCWAAGFMRATAATEASCQFFCRAANNIATSPFVNWGIEDASGGTANAIAITVNNSGGLVTSATVVLGLNVYHAVVASAPTAGTSVNWWADGKPQTTLSGIVFGDTTTGDNIIIGTDNGGPGGYQGQVYWGAFWDRTLTQAEAVRLYNDPYCFLIYPEDEMFATLVGIAAATTSEDQFHQPWSSVGRRYAIIAAG